MRAIVRRGERGQVLPIMSVAMVAVMGLTGMVTDIGTYFTQNRVQQNAAEAGANAAAYYWAAHFGSATDNNLYCIAQLYASTTAYQALVPSKCPASNAAVPDNLGRGTHVYYVDFAGNQLGEAGGLGAISPLAPFPTASGIRVTTSSTSGAFFSRLFNVNGFAVNDTATDRIGSAGSLPPQSTVSVPVPGTTTLQNGLKILPAAFNLTTYQSAILYAPTPTFSPSQVSSYTTQCGNFCWSGLQCLGSNSNNTVSTFLTGGNPCPGMPTSIATQSSSLCTSTPPSTAVSCVIESDPGTRDVDFTDVQQLWSGGVAIVPIVGSGWGQVPLVQFAWMYISGTSGTGSNSTINGFFLDPAFMPPLPAGLGGPCVAGSGIPCSVTGG